MIEISQMFLGIVVLAIQLSIVSCIAYTLSVSLPDVSHLSLSKQLSPAALTILDSIGIIVCRVWFIMMTVLISMMLVSP